MKRYNVITTKTAKRQLIGCYLYIYYEFQNPLAADSFLRDYNNVIGRLEYIASSLPLCEDEALNKRGFRIIHFKKHRYKLLYRVDENNAVIEAVYHNLQETKDPSLL